VQPPRHASRHRAGRVRRLTRSGLVGVLAVPSLLGLTTAMATMHPPRPAGRTTRGDSAAAVPAPAVHSVVGLGDSVPAGSACGCNDYVRLLGRSLSRPQGSPVRTSNLAAPGETSADLVTQLGTVGARSVLAGADVVVVTVGANDVESVDPTTCRADPGEDGDATVAACYGQQLDALTRNLDRALAQVGTLTSASGSRILVTGYWNVFLDGTVGRARGTAYMHLADAATRAVNARIAEVAKAYGDVFVDLFTPFRGSDGARDCSDLLAPDGDHPDAEGHVLIARELASAL